MASPRRSSVAEYEIKRHERLARRRGLPHRAESWRWPSPKLARRRWRRRRHCCGGSGCIRRSSACGRSNGLAYRLIVDHVDEDYWRNFGKHRETLVAPSLAAGRARLRGSPSGDVGNGTVRGARLLVASDGKGRVLLS